MIARSRMVSHLKIVMTQQGAKHLSGQPLETSRILQDCLLEVQ